MYNKVCKIRIIYPASNLPSVMADTKESKELHLCYIVYLCWGEDKMLFVGVFISCILLFLVFI